MGSDEVDIIGSPRSIEEESETLEVEFDLNTGDLTIPINANQSFLYTEPDNIFIEAAREILETIFAAEEELSAGLHIESPAFIENQQPNISAEISNNLSEEEAIMNTPGNSMQIIESSTQSEEINQNEMQEVGLPENLSNEAGITLSPERADANTAKKEEPASFGDNSVSSSSIVMMENEPEYKCLQNNSINVDTHISHEEIDIDKNIQPDSSTNGSLNETPVTDKLGESDHTEINFTEGHSNRHDPNTDRSNNLITVCSKDNTIQNVSQSYNMDVDPVYNFNKIDASMMEIDQEADTSNQIEGNKEQKPANDERLHSFTNSESNSHKLQDEQDTKDEQDTLKKKENHSDSNGPSMLKPPCQTTVNSGKNFFGQNVNEKESPQKEIEITTNKHLDDHQEGQLYPVSKEIEKYHKSSENNLQEEISQDTSKDIEVKDSTSDLPTSDERESKMVAFEESLHESAKRTETNDQSKIIEIRIGVYNESTNTNSNIEKKIEPDSTKMENSDKFQQEQETILNEKVEKYNYPGNNIMGENKAITTGIIDKSAPSVSNISPTSSYSQINSTGDIATTKEMGEINCESSTNEGREEGPSNLPALSKCNDKTLSVQHLPLNKENNATALSPELVTSVGFEEFHASMEGSKIIESNDSPAGMKQESSEREIKQIADESTPLECPSEVTGGYNTSMEDPYEKTTDLVEESHSVGVTSALSKRERLSCLSPTGTEQESSEHDKQQFTDESTRFETSSEVTAGFNTSMEDPSKMTSNLGGKESHSVSITSALSKQECLSSLSPTGMKQESSEHSNMQSADESTPVKTSLEVTGGFNTCMEDPSEMANNLVGESHSGGLTSTLSKQERLSSLSPTGMNQESSEHSNMQSADESTPVKTSLEVTGGFNTSKEDPSEMTNNLVGESHSGGLTSTLCKQECLSSLSPTGTKQESSEHDNMQSTDESTPFETSSEVTGGFNASMEDPSEMTNNLVGESHSGGLTSTLCEQECLSSLSPTGTKQESSEHDNMQSTDESTPFETSSEVTGGFNASIEDPSEMTNNLVGESHSGGLTSTLCEQECLSSSSPTGTKQESSEHDNMQSTDESTPFETSSEVTGGFNASMEDPSEMTNNLVGESHSGGLTSTLCEQECLSSSSPTGTKQESREHDNMQSTDESTPFETSSEVTGGFNASMEDPSEMTNNLVGESHSGGLTSTLCKQECLSSSSPTGTKQESREHDNMQSTDESTPFETSSEVTGGFNASMEDPSEMTNNLVGESRSGGLTSTLSKQERLSSLSPTVMNQESSEHSNMQSADESTPVKTSLEVTGGFNTSMEDPSEMTNNLVDECHSVGITPSIKEQELLSSMSPTGMKQESSEHNNTQSADESTPVKTSSDVTGSFNASMEDPSEMTGNLVVESNSVDITSAPSKHEHDLVSGGNNTSMEDPSEMSSTSVDESQSVGITSALGKQGTLSASEMMQESSEHDKQFADESTPTKSSSASEVSEGFKTSMEDPSEMTSNLVEERHSVGITAAHSEDDKIQFGDESTPVETSSEVTGGFNTSMEDPSEMTINLVEKSHSVGITPELNKQDLLSALSPTEMNEESSENNNKFTDNKFTDESTTAKNSSEVTGGFKASIEDAPKMSNNSSDETSSVLENTEPVATCLPRGSNQRCSQCHHKQLADECYSCDECKNVTRVSSDDVSGGFNTSMNGSGITESDDLVDSVPTILNNPKPETNLLPMSTKRVRLKNTQKRKQPRRFLRDSRGNSPTFEYSDTEPDDLVIDDKKIKNDDAAVMISGAKGKKHTAKRSSPLVKNDDVAVMISDTKGKKHTAKRSSSLVKNDDVAVMISDAKGKKHTARRSSPLVMNDDVAVMISDAEGKKYTAKRSSPLDKPEPVTTSLHTGLKRRRSQRHHKQVVDESSPSERSLEDTEGFIGSIEGSRITESDDENITNDNVPVMMSDAKDETMSAALFSSLEKPEPVTSLLPTERKRKSSQCQTKQLTDESTSAKRRSPRISKYPARLEYHKKGEC